jgi:hypothetical protein
LFAEVGFAALLVEGFVTSEDGLIIGRASGEQVINDTGEFVSGGGDRFGGAEAGAYAPEIIAQGRVAATCETGNWDRDRAGCRAAGGDRSRRLHP